MNRKPGAGDSILDRLRADIEAMPPGILLPRDWVLGRLSEPTDAPLDSPVVATRPSVDLTVRDLASLYERRPSTVRAWVERGDFPGAYKLHGKEWRIPAASLEAFQDQQRREPTRQRPKHRLSDWRKVNRS